MTEYIGVAIESDPEELLEQTYEYLATLIPGWTASPGNLEAFLAEAFSRAASETTEVASDVPTSIFRYFGATVMNLPPVDAVPATATSTWTMRDNAGHTIPAGTVVGIPSGDGLVAFETLNEVIVPSNETVAEDVELVSVEAGAAGNDLTGLPQLIDALDFVLSIVLVDPPAGGADAEDDDVYLNRLATELQLMAPRPILARDFAVLARRIAGVDRALAIDGYNTVDDTEDNERMVTVVPVDADGEAVQPATKTAVVDYLESLREVNFVVNVDDPTYTTVDVTFTATAYPSWDVASVELAAEAAVADYLSPADWGQPKDGDEREWVQTTKVRYGELYEVINRVSGIDYVDTLTLRKGADAFAQADVTLTGVAPMPRSGVVTGTVAAP